jgi:2,3-diketo-5-methylthio-1-phosphopentane phosphatase
MEITEQIKDTQILQHTKNTLVIFDFDQTIINGDTYSILISLLNRGKEELEKMTKSDISWIDFNKILFQKLKENEVNIEVIRKRVMSIELNKNMKDVLEFLKINKDKFKPIIISGSIKLIVQLILENYGCLDVIEEIHCHEARLDDDKYLHYVEKEHKNCGECSWAICKAVILQDVLKKDRKKYEKLIYVGDGLIDKCPIKILKETDSLYPRMNYPLYKCLYEDGYIHQCKCKVHPWEDGNKILESIL